MLEVTTTEPGLQLFTPQLDLAHIERPVRGTDGEAAGYALETQHYPDSPNRPDFPSVVLAKGNTFRSTTRFAFSVSEPPASCRESAVSP